MPRKTAKPKRGYAGNGDTDVLLKPAAEPSAEAVRSDAPRAKAAGAHGSAKLRASPAPARDAIAPAQSTPSRPRADPPAAMTPAHASADATSDAIPATADVDTAGQAAVADASASSGSTPPRAGPPPSLRPRTLGFIPAPARHARWVIGGSPLLTFALAGSVLVHAVVLSIHFRADLKRMLDRGPTLEVSLVNARSDSRPAQPDILAQANLDGGGNTDADRKAKTPLPAMPTQTVSRREMTLATQEIESMEKRATELMTQLRSTPVTNFVVSAPEHVEQTELPSTSDLTQRALESMRLEAQVAKEMDAYQKRPKRRFVGAQAEEYRFARYVEDWRLKVERIGNLNYPEAARQMKLYGSLILSVSIRQDGSLEGVEITRSSGHRILDAAAVRIVEMGAPYSPLPADVRRDTDVLVITRTWSFTRGEELRSQ